VARRSDIDRARAALAAEGVCVTSAVLREDGSAELELAIFERPDSPVRFCWASAARVGRTRYYCNAQLEPIRRTAQHVSARLAAARRKIAESGGASALSVYT
jgi:hypothetical protein